MTRKAVRPGKWSAPSANARFIVLSAFLAACFALGGSARSDVASLMILRPLAALVLAWGLWTLRLRSIRRYRFLFIMAALILALPALQLVPLQPALWTRLPGRDLIAAIDQAAGLGAIWRPMTMTPPETVNAFFALLIPLAVLVVGSGLETAKLGSMLLIVLAIGGASAFLALMQQIGGQDSPLYFYDITNRGSAVGLFANRNHQALFLAMLLPMLGVAAANAGRKNPLAWWSAGLAGLLLLPMILITGSRLGLIAAAVGLLSLPYVMAARRRSRRQRLVAVSGWAYLAAAGVLTASVITAVTVHLGRAVAVTRLVASEPADDLRVKILPTLFAMIRDNWAFGTGMGSFEKVYFVHEPDALLSPVYMNHAHNDWLELVLNGGTPAVLLLCAALAAFAWQAWRSLRRPDVHRSDLRLNRLGLVLLLLAAVGSISDYPLRTPALAALLALAALWAASPGEVKDKRRRSEPSSLPQ